MPIIDRPKDQRRMSAEEEKETTMPCLEFCSEWIGEEGSESWKAMSKRVREACESYGFFLLKCDDKMIPKRECEEMLENMKKLFDLPKDTKQKHASSKAHRSYMAKWVCESFGIDDPMLPHLAKAFTDLMWPQGNHPFSETINIVGSKLHEVCFLIHKMIVEAFGLPPQYISDAKMLNSCSNLRLMKYHVPPQSNTDSHELGLVPHTDKSTLTILCQIEQVQGLQILSKHGNWIPLNIPHAGLVVIVGDVLKAWSNGRIHAVKHRVMLRGGDKDRYTFGLFSIPKEETMIEVPAELVDEDHPLRYRPFQYEKFFSFYASTNHENALEVIAGAV